MSSEKILNFLINDILDFAQIRQNKFRKDTQTFNIKEAVKEIILVQGHKAEFNGINVRMNFENFPLSKNYSKRINLVERSSFGSKDYDLEICTDQRRLQQVLLNLLSNSLKFTKCGGSITINVKYIRDWYDLTYQEDFENLKKQE